VLSRAQTLLTAGLLAVGLFVAAWFLPVPYVIFSPGPTQDTLGTLPSSTHQLITISGRPTYPTTGHLILLTVLLTGGPGQQPTLLSAIRAWMNRQDTVIPQQFEFPPGQSSQQVQQQNLQQMLESQNDAITAALGQLGLPGQLEVEDVTAGTPAARALKVGDVVQAIDGHPVTEVTQLTHIIRSTRAGGTLRFTVRRGRRVLQLTVGTERSGGVTIVGFIPREIPTPPLSVRIDLNDVGGPSAGMMFALGIVDKLTPGGLTGGRSIAGTGTIDFAGDVGPIGGIQQKVFGALAAGATVFLAPQSECPDAQRVAPPRMRVIPVTTLAGAVADLEALDRGGTVPRC
jgi:PDZ domain-containing protein